MKSFLVTYISEVNDHMSSDHDMRDYREQHFFQKIEVAEVIDIQKTICGHLLNLGMIEQALSSYLWLIPSVDASTVAKSPKS